MQTDVIGYIQKPAVVETDPFIKEYRLTKRLVLALLVVALGILIAGFWNYHIVDGFGRDFVAGKTLGDTSALSGSYAERGSGFGLIFAMIAGLAATFTACNCVAFAMLPGLACTPDGRSSRSAAFSALAAFVVPVILIGAAYGVFVGFLGAEGATAFNQRNVRMAQARSIFSLIGIAMLFWGLIEMGFLRRYIVRLSPLTRAFFSMPSNRAFLMGVLVGLFAVGRPFPVFRHFLAYAASAESPAYGALVMGLHGIGQIAILLGLFFVLVFFGGQRMMRWASEKPHQPRLVTALALLGGGSYFVFYWGISRLYDIGGWGFKLGWY